MAALLANQLDFHLTSAMGLQDCRERIDAMQEFGIICGMTH